MTIPTKLYKYRPINEFTKDIICNHRIWFAKPATLNDPFDCQIQVVFQPDEEQLKDYAKLSLGGASDVGSQDNEWLVNLLLQQSLDNYDDLMSSLRELGRKRVEQESSLLCLSTKCDDILMFAHYADCHRGCVLEFNIDWNDEIGQVFPVTYRETYPQLDYFTMRGDGIQLMKDLLLSKYLQWEYEAEYRVLRYGKQEGLVPFREDALTAIILGCLTRETDRKQITEWNSTRRAPCRLYQAKVNPSEYKLDLASID